MLVWLALIPFALLAYLLVVREWSAKRSLALVYVSLVAILIWAFGNPLSLILAGSARGVLLAAEVFLIIVGVLLIFSLMQRTGRLESFKDFFLSYHSDQRIHIILIGWFFVAFLEGIAGFGAPAAIAAPLLVALGVRPLAAVVVTLIADSAAVVFGAFGTPVIVGLAGAGIDAQSATLPTAVLAGTFAVFVPLIMLVVHARLSDLSLRSVVPYIWFALTSGLVFAVGFVATAHVFGPELPSVIAPIVGLCVMIGLLSLGVFGPAARIPPVKGVLKALLPYGLVVGLLLSSRANLLGFGDFLRTVGFTVNLGHDISHTLSAYSPGVLIIAAFLLSLLLVRDDAVVVRQASVEASKKASSVLLALVFAIAFAQLVVFSDAISGIGIPQVIAQSLSQTGMAYFLLAPLIGAFGSFVAGSATVSNLMFASVQQQAALSTGLSEQLIIALQAVGASAGNMIAIHNIVAVLAVVHLSKGLPTILRTNVLVVLGYCLLVSLIVLAAVVI